MSAFRGASDALGMQEPIDRRDFVNSMLLASGSALLGALSPRQLLASDDWTGYAGVGDYARSNGNTYEVISAGHQIRDRVFSKNAPKSTLHFIRFQTRKRCTSSSLTSSPRPGRSGTSISPSRNVYMVLVFSTCSPGLHTSSGSSGGRMNTSSCHSAPIAAEACRNPASRRPIAPCRTQGTWYDSASMAILRHKKIPPACT